MSHDILVFLSRRGYLGEIESGYKPHKILLYSFFAYHVLGQSQCFQFSSPDLQWFTRHDSRIFYPFSG